MMSGVTGGAGSRAPRAGQSACGDHVFAGYFEPAINALRRVKNMVEVFQQKKTLKDTRPNTAKRFQEYHDTAVMTLGPLQEECKDPKVATVQATAANLSSLLRGFGYELHMHHRNHELYPESAIVAITNTVVSITTALVALNDLKIKFVHKGARGTRGTTADTGYMARQAEERAAGVSQDGGESRHAMRPEMGMSMLMPR